MDYRNELNSDWPAMEVRLQTVLNAGYRLPATEKTVEYMNRLITDQFAQAMVLGKRLIVADGLVVSCGRVALENRDTLVVSWQGQFYPRARWACPEGEYIPLGFHEEFDLYVGINEGGLPPTLIARYGDEPGDYATFNPTLAGEGAVSSYGAAFIQAMMRAQLLNVDLHSY